MPDCFSKASSVGIDLPFTSMYSGQFEKTSRFCDEERSVLLQLDARLHLGLGAAGARAGRGPPAPRAPTEAPRRKERRLDSGSAPRARHGSTDMDYLQVVGLPECG